MEANGRSPVIAVLAGHWHHRGGFSKGFLRQRGPVMKYIENKWNSTIPVYRSWGADKQRFLLIQYNEYACKWRMGSVQAKYVQGLNGGGGPKWYSQGDNIYPRDDGLVNHNVYHIDHTLKDCVPNLDANPTGTDGEFISFVSGASLADTRLEAMLVATALLSYISFGFL